MLPPLEIQKRLQKLEGKHLIKLLTKEKKRRRLGTDELVFVGVSNVAKHWWCTQQAVFSSRRQEAMFFNIYLHDRLTCALRLGRLDCFPSDDEGLLDIAQQLTLEDRENLTRDESALDSGVTFVQEERREPSGRWNVFINPDLPQGRPGCASA